MAELERLGVRSVPVLSRGDKYTFGQSTKQIIEFLGLGEKTGPELSTDELAARVTKFMDAALELIPLMPADRLGIHVPGRPRSYRTLAFHLFRVVDAFLDANENITLVQAMFREEPAADANPGDLVAYGTKVRERFRAWWQAGDTAPSRRSTRVILKGIHFLILACHVPGRILRRSGFGLLFSSGWKSWASIARTGGSTSSRSTRASRTRA